MRALVISHGHPRAGLGGGEIAAANLFRALKENAGLRAVSFLARTASPDLAPGRIADIGDGEYLWRCNIEDWFDLRGEGRSATLAAFLRGMAPDVVFLQHYVHLGIEILGAIRQILPAARIVLTLHDFAAICHNGGLMAKTGFARLPCAAASPAACHDCFPDRPAAGFEDRRAAMLGHFAAVDRFVAPSRFVARRYAEWGLPADRIAVVENGLEPMADAMPEPSVDGRVRFGFFGQVREAKGLDILLAALHRLGADERARLVLEVNGSRLEAQPTWYRTLIERLRDPLMAEGTLVWPGPYAREELPRRMRRLDWAVVPSTWWENSPIVIQEAFRFRLPVIGSRHGGIAEKVRDGTDGLLFEPRDPAALADLLRRVVAAPHLRETMARALPRPPSMAEMGDAYLRLVSA